MLFSPFFSLPKRKNRKLKKNAIFGPKNGIKITGRHEIGVQNVQLGQKYVKRGQKGPKWANTDQKGVEIDQKRPKT